MRIGVVVPTFCDDFSTTRRALADVEDAGLDGAFVYDHLWPMGHRADPAIAAMPALGGLAAVRRRATLGTLVARVGVVPPEVLVRELVTIHAASSGALIAGLGTADRKGAEEYIGYGLEFPSADARRAELRVVAAALVDAKVPVWVGAGDPGTNAIAHDLGVTLNFWGASADRVAEAAAAGPVSWAGNPPTDGSIGALVGDLADAGATWAVFSRADVVIASGVRGSSTT